MYTLRPMHFRSERGTISRTLGLETRLGYGAVTPLRLEVPYCSPNGETW
jgi:hypothetical protein